MIVYWLNSYIHIFSVSELGNPIEVLTVGDDTGEGSGEDGESMPVCSVERDASADDLCAEAAIAPMQLRPRRDLSPSQVSIFE